MRIQFSSEVSYVPTFNGNHDLPEEKRLQATLGVMDINDYFSVLDALQKIGFVKGSEKDMKMSQMIALAKESGSLVTKYVKFTQGNENFNVADVIRFPVFFALATELLFQLVSIASPTEQDVKN